MCITCTFKQWHGVFSLKKANVVGQSSNINHFHKWISNSSIFFSSANKFFLISFSPCEKKSGYSGPFLPPSPTSPIAVGSFLGAPSNIAGAPNNIK